jgi:hypothetical protein
MDTMLELVHSPSLYVRENAIHAIYSVGDVEYAIRALLILNESTYYHNTKMITDGLLKFLILHLFGVVLKKNITKIFLRQEETLMNIG